MSNLIGLYEQSISRQSIDRESIDRESEYVYYIDKGSELRAYYCPSGFRFITNLPYIDDNRYVEEYTKDYIQKCWKYYGSVAVGPAFDINGFTIDYMISVYVKKAIPIMTGIICHKCGYGYKNEDIIHIDTDRNKFRFCKNCFSVFNYDEVLIVNKTVLVYKW